MWHARNLVDRAGLTLMVVALLAAQGLAGADEAEPPAAEPAPVVEAEVAGEPGLVGWLELSGPLRNGPVPFAWVDEADAEPSLERVLAQLSHVAASDAHSGLVIHLDQPELTLAQIQALGEAIKQVRATGKHVATFAQRYAMRDYLLASAADQVMLQHRGQVELSGLAVEEMYLAPLLGKIGVEADLVQVGRFKGAADPLTRSEPSPAWNENIDALIEDLYEHLVHTIADNRGLTAEGVERLTAEAWTMPDRRYLETGLVDRLVDRQMQAATEAAFGIDFAWDDSMGQASASRRIESPMALIGRLFEDTRPRVRRPSIAVVRIVGPITSGDSSIGDGLFSSDSAGSRTILRALGQARDDPQVRGVVLQIDSPGGSALASEVIWQGVRELSEHKPVYASLGDLAASGGYYVAVAADEIYAHAGTVVGSIGVVGGKLVLGELYETLGVHVHRRSRGPMADMFNSVEPFTEEQRASVRAALEGVYGQFVDRVERGRGDRLPDVDAVAHGRLFTGRQAVDRGLADAVGSLRDARQALAAELGLTPGEYDVIHLPPPLNLGEFLGTLFGVQAPASAGAGGGLPGAASAAGWLEATRQALGPARFATLRQIVTGLALLKDEPALTLMPYGIVIE